MEVEEEDEVFIKKMKSDICFLALCKCSPHSCKEFLSPELPSLDSSNFSSPNASRSGVGRAQGPALSLVSFLKLLTSF